MTILTIHSAIARCRDCAAKGLYPESAKIKQELYNDFVSYAASLDHIYMMVLLPVLAAELIKVEDIEIKGFWTYD